MDEGQIKNRQLLFKNEIIGGKHIDLFRNVFYYFNMSNIYIKEL